MKKKTNSHAKLDKGHRGTGIRFDTSPSKTVSSFSMKMRVGQILVLLR
jgi:hypothetical protein